MLVFFVVVFFEGGFTHLVGGLALPLSPPHSLTGEGEHQKVIPARVCCLHCCLCVCMFVSVFMFVYLC